MNFEEAHALAKSINDEAEIYGEERPPEAIVFSMPSLGADGYGIDLRFWDKEQYEAFHTWLHRYC